MRLGNMGIKYRLRGNCRRPLTARIFRTGNIWHAKVSPAWCLMHGLKNWGADMAIRSRQVSSGCGNTASRPCRICSRPRNPICFPGSCLDGTRVSHHNFRKLFSAPVPPTSSPFPDSTSPSCPACSPVFPPDCSAAPGELLRQS